MTANILLQKPMSVQSNGWRSVHTCVTAGGVCTLCHTCVTAGGVCTQCNTAMSVQKHRLEDYDASQLKGYKNVRNMMQTWGRCSWMLLRSSEYAAVCVSATYLLPVFFWSYLHPFFFLWFLFFSVFFSVFTTQHSWIGHPPHTRLNKTTVEDPWSFLFPPTK